MPFSFHKDYLASFILTCFYLSINSQIQPVQLPDFSGATINQTNANTFMGGSAQDVLNSIGRKSATAMGHPFEMVKYGVTNTQENKLKDYYSEINSSHINERLLSYQNTFIKNIHNSTDLNSYKDALSKIKNMLSGKAPLSLKDAYYYTEAAFGNSYIDKANYDARIKQAATFIKTWLSQNNYPLTPANLQFGLQQFMGKQLTVTNKTLDNEKAKKVITHEPFKYDYADYEGKSDFRNLFLTKCLATGSGQCASLPLVHVVIAQQLGISSYVAFSPFHSYNKFKDENGNLTNYEPTSNWSMPDKWYQENFFISPKAKQTGIYLSPLSNKQMVANSLVDMVINYVNKTNQIDTAFTNECLEEAKKYFPENNNIYLHLVNSHILNYELVYSMKRNHITDFSKIPANSDTNKIYEKLLRNENLIKSLGYQDLPQDVYEQMLEQQNNHVLDSSAKQVKTLFKTD